MGELFEKWMCWLGRCWNCRTVSNADGIGGQCVRCGKIHGWVTREELLAYADRLARDPAERARVERYVSETQRKLY